MVFYLFYYHNSQSQRLIHERGAFRSHTARKAVDGWVSSRRRARLLFHPVLRTTGNHAPYSRITSRIQLNQWSRVATRALMNGVSRARGLSPSTSRAFAMRTQDTLIKIRRDRTPAIRRSRRWPVSLEHTRSRVRSSHTCITMTTTKTLPG